MKKILIFSLILAFLVPLAVFSADHVDSTTVSANGQVLEKILSPEQIKFFRVMKKEGNTLYGVRLEKAKEAMKNASETSSATVKGAVSNLEKIAGPWDVQLFDKIRQVGNALWGYRKPVSENLGIKELNSDNIICIKTAIDKKDTSIKKTVVVASDELNTAIDTRNVCQKAALDLGSNYERMKAWKLCNENFQKAVKESRVNSKKYRDEAWKIYKQEVKDCYSLEKISACSDSTCANTSSGDVSNSTDEAVSSESANLLLEDGGEMLDL